MNLYGNIKRILEETRNINGELVMTKETYFTNSGMVKSIEYSYPESQIFYKSINYFNDRNWITRQDFLKNDSLVLYQKYIRINPFKDSLLAYDPNNDLLNIGILNYNDNKQVLESKLFDIQNKLISLEVTEYDTNYRLKEIRVESADPLLNQGVYKFCYDSIGRINKLTEINPIEKSESTENYKYIIDEMNNWIEKEIYTSDGEIKAKVTRKIEYK